MMFAAQMFMGKQNIIFGEDKCLIAKQHHFKQCLKHHFFGSTPFFVECYQNTGAIRARRMYFL